MKMKIEFEHKGVPEQVWEVPPGMMVSIDGTLSLVAQTKSGDKTPVVNLVSGKVSNIPDDTEVRRINAVVRSEWDEC